MIITRGLGASRLVTRGYGPDAAPPLSEIDTGYKGLSTRGFESLTRTRSAKVLKKRTVSEK
jgi:hypothetical protein